MNRPYENEAEEMVKPHGFVLDFVGIFDKLEKALAFDSAEIVQELLHFSVPNHGRLWKSLMRAHLGDWETLAERLPKITRSR